MCEEDIFQIEPACDIKPPRRIMIVGSGMAGSLSGHYKTAMINQLIGLLAAENIQIVDASAMPEIIVSIKDPNVESEDLQTRMEKVLIADSLSNFMSGNFDPCEDWYRAFPVQRHYIPRAMVYQKPRKIKNPKQRVKKWIKK